LPIPATYRDHLDLPGLRVFDISLPPQNRDEVIECA